MRRAVFRPCRGLPNRPVGRGLRRKRRDWSTGVDGRLGAKQSWRARQVGATPSAVRPRIALGVIDRGPAANGVDRSTSYDTPRLKRSAIGKITYVTRV